MTLQQTIDLVMNWLGIHSNIETCAFLDYKSIPHSCQGVYVIVQGDRTIYVGKGQVRSRQQRHLDKALALGRARDTQGWAWLRDNTVINTQAWTVLYVQLPSQTQRVALEGSLIHLLQPLANDETFLDRKK